jgi:hypothetical protein
MKVLSRSLVVVIGLQEEEKLGQDLESTFHQAKHQFLILDL